MPAAPYARMGPKAAHNPPINSDVRNTLFLTVDGHRRDVHDGSNRVPVTT